MATIKEAIYSILSTDAQNGNVGHLGNLLGHTGDSPYGVFFMNPPEEPNFPLITYSEVSGAGSMPKIEAFNFTVWGNNYEAIHELIYGLLHKQPLGTTTGTQVVQLMWNWYGPVVYDQNYYIYVQTHRYLSKGVKI